VKLYVSDTLLQRLAQDLEDMAAALRQFVQAGHAVVRQRPLARRGEVPAADPPHSRNRLRRGATRAGRDQRRAGAGEASDAVAARGLDGVGQAHRRQDGGEPPR
jgi:hypothetical protein